MPNNLSQFWQELKRRRIHRMLAIYAGSSYVIFEASTLIFPRWGLPDWTIDMVLYLLILGAIITFVLSWIYDLTPDGVQKTKPASEIPHGEVPTTTNGWKIASYISVVVIVVLIILNIIPRTGKKEILDKSIAVLPFINDSQDLENEHFINGIMEELLINLQTIKELRVPGRTSTEQYRNNPKPIPEIATEMNVAYVVEGSGQRFGDIIRLRVQLVEGATDRHIWADSYDEVINGPEDIFRIQSEIAQAIAVELQALITPHEKQLIEIVPTTNLTALDYYQEARDNYWEYYLHGDSKVLQRAEYLYYKALDTDPTFAQAYNGLARIYWQKHGREEYLSESYLDSLLILTDIALSYNQNISETYVIRGRYYGEINNFEQAISEYNKALQLNPNEWMAYRGKAILYANIDNFQKIQNLHKAINLNRGKELSSLIFALSETYYANGFEKQGKKYAEQYLELTGDSVTYYNLSVLVPSSENEERIVYLKRAYELDSSNLSRINDLANEYSFHGYYDSSFKYFKKYLAMGGSYASHRIAYTFWKNGFKEEANYFFDQFIEFSKGEIEMGRRWASTYYPYYDMAGVYAFRGDIDKALENLRLFNRNKDLIPFWFVNTIKKDPLFNGIRDNSEFQAIVKDIEAKYQADHERIRQWLEENDML